MATVKKIRRSVAPFYGVAAVWVVYALAFDLYRPTHFIFAAVLSAGVYLLLRAVCKDEEYEVEIRNGWTEYDFEIDAVTGTIFSRDIDNDRYD